MSTRSGKRIHASSDSPIVNADTLQSERKTRSVKQKENIELSVLKRHNYVSYPTDDETASVSSDATETHEKVRKTRRNTLKEHNIHVPVSDSLDSNNINNTVRKTRRGKKLKEEPESSGDKVNVQKHAKSEPVAAEKKRNKKKKNHKNDSTETTDMQYVKNHIINKKGINKKSRELNSVINDQETEPRNPDIHDASDSFHSAAGSPVNMNYIESDCQMEVAINIVGHKTKDCSHTTDVKSADPSTTKSTDIIIKKKRKLEKKEIINDEENTYNENTSFNKSSDLTITSNTMSEIASKKERKSSIKDSTFDKIEEDTNEVKFDTTFDKSSDVTITSNTISERATKKKKKSSIKDSTMDKIEIDTNEEKLNTTFDKSSDVTITSNTMSERATKKKKKSSMKDSTFEKTEIDINEEKLNTTFDKLSDVTITSNTTSERATKKKSKSSSKDSTFNNIEKDNNEQKLNTTFDKSPDVTITSNTSSKITTKKIRRSSIKDSTFDKIEKDINDVMLNTTFDKNNIIEVSNIIGSTTTMSEITTKKKRKFSFKDSTLDKIEEYKNKNKLNTTFDRKADTPTAANTTEDVSSRKRKRSIKNCTIDLDEDNINTNFSKTANQLSSSLHLTVDVSTKKRRKCSIKNSTFKKFETSETNVVNEKPFNSTFGHVTTANNAANGFLTENGNKSNVSITFTALQDPVQLDETLHETSNGSRKSSLINTTYDKIEKDLECNEVNDLNGTFDKDDTHLQISSVNNKSHSRKNSLQNNKILNEQLFASNGESASEGNVKTKNFDSTFNNDNNIELNTTFDTEKKLEVLVDSNKSSLISSDATINGTFDKSGDNSRISITSDESKSENILNHTPVLIESSIDESVMSEDKSPVNTPDVPVTPLKREGTFTKKVSDIIMSPKPVGSAEKTPVKRKSSPGCTPFPFSKSSQKVNAKLNVTRSIEKSLRKSSLLEVAPRQTRVMFCSPANNPTVVSQVKARVIKSNLKGSNKSFVFDDSVSSEARAIRRKRSLTLGAVGTAGTAGDADSRAKRKRLGDELQNSVDRLSRPRTQSAAAKLSEPGTPGKTKPESKVSRTKLPNFAALHQKQFARMESLDECQRRRARRARQLLTPTGSVGLLERISPKETPPKPAPLPKEPATKHHTPFKPKLPTLDSLIPRYNRFGFKLDVDENPFSAGRGEERARGARGARACLPSLAGATSRREAARQAVMREKSFSEKRTVKRNETRTVIKGVRTNRRFELQMKMRNVNP